jgi:hypothetical protein
MMTAMGKTSSRLTGLALALLVLAGCKFDATGAAPTDRLDAGEQPDAPAGSHRLTVAVHGHGRITSMPAGIDCGLAGTACTLDLATGTAVQLSATPAAQVRWSGDCSLAPGTASCPLVLDQDRSVTATFPGPATLEQADLEGSSGDDQIRALAVAADGDLVIAGSFGSDDFELLDGPSDALGHQDGFVARLSPTGLLRWVVVAGGPAADDAINGVALDADGDVLITGEVAGGGLEIGSCAENDQPGDPLSGTGSDTDVLIASLDGTSGDCNWALRKGAASDDRGRAIATSGAHVYVVGSFRGSMSFGSGISEELTSAGGQDAMIIDLERTDGAVSNYRSFGGGGSDVARAVAAAGGAITMGGTFSGNALLDTTHSSAGGTDGWFGSVDPTSLALSQVLIIDGDQDDSVNGLALGPGGVRALAARYSNDAALDGMHLPSAAAGNGLVATVTSGGSVGQLLSIHSSGEDSALAVSVGDDGAVAAVGILGGTFDFGYGPVATVGLGDLFALELSPAGVLEWVLADGSPQPDALQAVGFGSGVVFAAGFLGDDAELDTGNLTTLGGAGDGLLLRITR